MVQLVIQPREPFEPEFLRKPGTFFYARLKRLVKLGVLCIKMVQNGRPSVVNAVTFWPTYACTIPFGESTASARASEKKKKKEIRQGVAPVPRNQ